MAESGRMTEKWVDGDEKNGREWADGREWVDGDERRTVEDGRW
jgi:hypothetical protein